MDATCSENVMFFAWHEGLSNRISARFNTVAAHSQFYCVHVLYTHIFCTPRSGTPRQWTSGRASARGG
jgi:hypothetical protein